ncbi:terminase small subunit-like protein [Fodinicurvata halophila]|uniref:terminase small subunit-like protein n=1 Tax=Fodinicurvata halophila TaxID=1419723 RepID=UPI003632757A
MSPLGGGEVLGQLCGRRGIPERAAVLAALAGEPGLARRFALALQLQRQQWAEEILEIADGSEPADPEGDGRLALSHARLRMEARRWVQEMTRRAAALPAEGFASDGSGKKGIADDSADAGAERAEALLAAAQLDRSERAFLRRLLNKRLARKDRRPTR